MEYGYYQYFSYRIERRPGQKGSRWYTHSPELGRRKTIYIAEWNVRTLLDSSKRPERQTALVAKELKRYNIDIAALCETRLANHGSLVHNGYIFFWSGRKENEKRKASASQ